MRKLTILFFTLSILLISNGCSVGKDLTGAYNMFNCEYKYNSISSLNISGIDLSRGVSITQIPQITSILLGDKSSIPVNFRLNVDINNPNKTTALLHGLQYIINIDNVEFTRGMVEQALNIESGQTQTLPLSIGLDLGALLKSDAKDTVMDVAKNLLGMGSKESKVNLQIKPTFLIANKAITSPTYIPVKFTLGGS